MSSARVEREAGEEKRRRCELEQPDLADGHSSTTRNTGSKKRCHRRLEDVARNDSPPSPTLAAAAANASVSSPLPPLPHAVASYPTISFHCLQRAQKTVQDFVQTYLFIFHADEEAEHDGVAASSESALISTHPSAASLQLMFRLLPLLTFVSGTIYQIDEENEEANARRRSRLERRRQRPRQSVSAGDGGSQEASSIAAAKDKMRQLSAERIDLDDEPSESSSSSSDESAADDLPSSKSYAVLCAVLRSQGLLTDRVQTELRKGRLYWQLERELCDRLAHHQSPRIEDVHIASQCKSFDYRVLNLVTYGARGVPPDELILSTLQLNEFLVDLNDDLVDYEDDIASHSFNVYRMYAALYGSAASTRMMQRINVLESKFATSLARIPPRLRARFEAREREAMREYGREGQDGSRWTIPQPILDEQAFRHECDEAEALSRSLQADDAESRSSTHASILEVLSEK